MIIPHYLLTTNCLNMLQLIVAIHAYIFLSQIGLQDTKLLFLQTIFRHGDRSPYYQYPGDPVTPEFWSEGYGMLTKLGRKQHYALGKYLREFYKDFITSYPNEVLVNSTGLDRCLSSAMSHLASLYAPEPKWKFDDNVNWQPIPVHYQPFEKDKYLSVHCKCPNAILEEQRIYYSPKYLQLTEKYNPMLLALSNYIGHIPTPIKAAFLFDNWLVQRNYNQTLPYWSKLFYSQLEEYSKIAIFELFDSALIQRLRAGPILGKMIENMNRKIAAEIPNLKVQVYSSQYYHLVAIMKALKVFNDLPCPYCATLLFELHEFPDNTKAVRLLYLNSTTPEHEHQVPHVLTMEGCFEYCPLDFFINYTKDLIPHDWEKECGIT